VLIAEDEYYLAQELKVAFERVGAIVLGPVSTEEEAAALVEQEAPDVAVLDLNLGKGPRFELAEFVRRHAVPVCVMSAYRAEDFQRMPESLRGVRWLEKPIRPDAVMSAAEEALR
jgi:DNA-binding response OmpR family regulator